MHLLTVPHLACHGAYEAMVVCGCTSDCNPEAVSCLAPSLLAIQETGMPHIVCALHQERNHTKMMINTNGRTNVKTQDAYMTYHSKHNYNNTDIGLSVWAQCLLPHICTTNACLQTRNPAVWTSSSTLAPYAISVPCGTRRLNEPFNPAPRAHLKCLSSAPEIRPIWPYIAICLKGRALFKVFCVEGEYI